MKVMAGLLQREMADADPIRMKLLVDQVFQPVYDEVSPMISQSAKGLDSHLLFISILGLVMYHFEISPMRRLLPGYGQEQDESEQLVDHILSLLESGIHLADK